LLLLIIGNKSDLFSSVEAGYAKTAPCISNSSNSFSYLVNRALHNVFVLGLIDLPPFVVRFDRSLRFFDDALLEVLLSLQLRETSAFLAR